MVVLVNAEKILVAPASNPVFNEISPFLYFII
jgi:hypothetical protein